ncbi:MAG: pilin N-terminal domain-containing protein [Lactococcus plantarum]|nr:pilin N-terminal domain-containing protein [Lactococcus plantarum]
MKKKWATWLSLLVLCLSIVANISQGYTVLADSLATDETMLIQDDDLLVSYKVTPTQTGNAWVIHYRYHAVEDGEKRRLKFQFLDSQGQPISVVPEKDWTVTKDNQLLGTFRAQDEGYVRLATDSSIPKVSLNIQADAQDKSGKLQSDILSKDLGKTYALTPPENTVASTSSASTASSSSAISASTSSAVSTTSNSVANSQTQARAASESSSTKTEMTRGINSSSAVSSNSLTSGNPTTADPFSYVKNGDVVYPTQGTSTYQNGKTDEDIVNYDFSKSSSEGQSSIKNIFGSGTLNFDNGYHYYQNDGYVKKIVMPTNDPTQFKVRLDMIGEELKTTKPVDIAMVLDASSSMNFRMQDDNAPGRNEKSRWQTMKDSVAYFANQLIGPSSNNNDNVRIGFTSFGSAVESGYNVPFSKIGKFSSNASFTSNYNQLLGSSIYNSSSAPSVSGTPTFLGVDAGYRMLTDTSNYGARSDSVKVLIILTDGQPTFWPITYSTGFNKDNGKSTSSYDYYKTSGYDGNGTYYETSNTNTINFVNQRANANQGISKYSIGLSTINDSGIKSVLKALGPDGTFEASDQQGLMDALDKIRTSISKSIQKGSLIDPMSQYVMLNTNSIQTYDLKVDSNSIAATGSNRSVKTDNNQISIDNLSIGKNEGVRVEYTVSLKQQYWDGQFHPANGTTYLQNNKLSPAQYLHFAVPSIKYDTFNLPVQKNWDDQNNQYQTRQDIILQLQSFVNNTWQNVSGKTFAIKASATDDQLKGVISGIPSKDGANQPIKYRFVELFGNTEQAVNGYATPSYSTPREITYTDIVNGNVSKDKPLAVTNTLLKTVISFTKVGNDNQTPLAGAEFTLYTSDGKTQIGSPVTSDKNGLVKFDQQVPIGKYLIKETKTPLGYVKASDISISVTAQNGQLVISGLPTGNKVKNILDDFKLIITKKDNNGNAVSGVKFKLVGPNNYNKEQESDTTNGNVFTFQGLKPGKYTLTETKTPGKYVGLKQDVIILIGDDGKVTIDGQPLPDQPITTTGNIIKLDVTNTIKGILPSTGGSGRTGYFIASLIFMGLVAIIGGIFYYRNRRTRHHQLLKGSVNKSHLLLLLLTTSIGISFTNAQTIAADEQPITFILHKRVFKDSGDLKTIKDNGLVITPNDQNASVIDSDKTYGLNGVIFDVYDVTSYVSNALKNTSKEALLKHVTNTDKADLLAEIKPYQPTSQEVVTASSNGEDGVASFTVHPTSQNSAYLILEKQISDKDAGQVNMTATPMLVILPVENPIDKTSFLTTIHLYPKNTAIKVPVIPPVNPVNPKPPHFPFLPDTGEVKSAMVVLGSTAVIIAVSFWYKRRKNRLS